MRLLRGIARAMGVPLFGSVTVLLANVYTAAAALNIDMPRSFRGHGQHANICLSDLSQLTDIAMQINMRGSVHSGRDVSLSMSPIKSVTPKGRVRGGRPQADTGQQGSALPKSTYPPHCVSVGCPCTATYNGEPGEHCCFACIQLPQTL